MKLAIIGGRDFPELHVVIRFVWTLPIDTQIISGGAHGVDSIAVLAAKARQMTHEPIELNADWDKYGRPAGMVRNAEVVKAVDRVVAFWDGESPGTKGAREITKHARKPLLTVFSNKQIAAQHATAVCDHDMNGITYIRETGFVCVLCNRLLACRRLRIE